MLALTRKTGDAIMINNNIEITVLEVRGDQVKIGISAPKEVSIYRKEVYLEIQKEKEAAKGISMDDLEHPAGVGPPSLGMVPPCSRCQGCVAAWYIKTTFLINRKSTVRIL